MSLILTFRFRAQVSNALFIVVLTIVYCTSLNGDERVVRTDIAQERGVNIISRNLNIAEHPILRIYVNLIGARDFDGRTRCFFFCSWKNKHVDLLDDIVKEDEWILKFAKEHNMAVITWNVENLIGSGELIRDRHEVLNLFCSQWVEFVGEVCRLYELELNGGVIYGVSRGATYVQALATRYPDLFSAVSTHIGGFFEDEIIAMSSPDWLLTTGSLDCNRDASLNKFYELRRNGGFPLMKVVDGLGHELSDDVDLLTKEFFNHALTVGGEGKPQRGGYSVADVISQKMVTNDSVDEGIDSIPTERRVYLPSRELSEVWMNLDGKRRFEDLKGGRAFLNSR